ncbi:MAG: porphobilinogen synthase [Zetaproteobacteria bacterium]|nr:MAG: porphobilinogen synthase [Zetaproteobacteria bacterium]
MPLPKLVRRPRRNRRTDAIRRLVRETVLTPNDLIYPLFVDETIDEPKPVPSMPGIARLPIREAPQAAKEAWALGIPAVILFGIPAHKDEEGSSGWATHGVVPRAVEAIKQAAPELCVIVDACFCEYTSHGHCGVLSGHEVDNDATLENLQKEAVAYAAAGADIIAPSGMMDGMVAAIRMALDDAGFAQVGILSYAVKYASAYYGPFRDAADSAPSFGDRSSYQMDPANRREARVEARLDVEEGADMLMVKPGLAYLDVIREVREITDLPLAAYNVSGEYAMVKAAAERGWLDERRVVLETLTAFKRAGADMILTYHALDAARWLHG